MEEKKEEPQIMIIHDNVIQNNKVLNIEKRNIAEALLFTILFCFIIASIPFVLKVKLIVCVIGGGSIFYANIVGIKNRSITQFIIDYVLFKKNSKKASLRSAKDGKIRSKSDTEKDSVTNKSYFEKIFEYGKSRYEEFLSKK